MVLSSTDAVVFVELLIVSLQVRSEESLNNSYIICLFSLQNLKQTNLDRVSKTERIFNGIMAFIGIIMMEVIYAYLFLLHLQDGVGAIFVNTILTGIQQRNLEASLLYWLLFVNDFRILYLFNLLCTFLNVINCSFSLYAFSHNGPRANLY